MQNLLKLMLFFFYSAVSLYAEPLFHSGSLVILPEDGRQVFFDAFAKAKKEIRIEICVLEDPLILESLQQALMRGIRVRVIVDRDKYSTTPAEQQNLMTYLIANGGHLHLSNPIFPRSFPKIVLIDNRYVLIGSACLDSLTFAQYRDYVYVSHSRNNIKELSKLFENDWSFSAEPNQPTPTFNPTPKTTDSHLMISPINSCSKFASFLQKAESTLELTTELLGDPTLESELFAAVKRGVRVRLIAPEIVNDADISVQQLQIASLNKLKAAGVYIHVTRPPETSQTPYMHARTAIADKKHCYIGSISLSPDSTTFNREVGIILKKKHVANKLRKQFNEDYLMKSFKY